MRLTRIALIVAAGLFTVLPFTAATASAAEDAKVGDYVSSYGPSNEKTETPEIDLAPDSGTTENPVTPDTPDAPQAPEAGDPESTQPDETDDADDLITEPHDPEIIPIYSVLNGAAPWILATVAGGAILAASAGIFIARQQRTSN